MIRLLRRYCALLLFLLPLAVVCGGCGDDDDTPDVLPVGALTMTMHGGSAGPFPSGSETITLTSAQFHLDAIDIYQTAHITTSIQHTNVDPIFVLPEVTLDLLAPTTRLLDEPEVEAGIFSNVVFSVSRGIPSLSGGATLMLIGSVEQGADRWDFSVLWEEEFVPFKSFGNLDFVLRPGGALDIAFAIDPAALFDGVSLSGLEPPGTPLQIDAGRHPTTLTPIIDNLYNELQAMD